MVDLAILRRYTPQNDKKNLPYPPLEKGANKGSFFKGAGAKRLRIFNQEILRQRLEILSANLTPNAQNDKIKSPLSPFKKGGKKASLLRAVARSAGGFENTLCHSEAKAEESQSRTQRMVCLLTTPLSPVWRMEKKPAFTLAEVLVTLGIIGIIAAMTMPMLISNYKKSVVEARLKRFYTTINQAVALAEEEWGEKKFWDLDNYNTDEVWELYFKPFLKYVRVDDWIDPGDTNQTYKMIFFADGSAALFNIYNWGGGVSSGGGHFVFFVNGYDALEYGKYAGKAGRTYFYFGFWPNQSNRNTEHFKHHAMKGVEPYRVWWDGHPRSLYTHSRYGCNNNHLYCAAIIQDNGWHIPKDYPKHF